MKRRILLALGVAMTSQAWAAGPVSAERLGGLDAVISFCSQVNPAGVAAYNAYRTSYVSQTSAVNLAHHPLTKAYKQAFAAVGTALSAAPSEWAAATCARSANRPTG